MSVGDHKEESEGDHQCRFCLESDRQTNLIAPCICKGTNKYVHIKCLLQWVSAEPERGLKCSACLETYAQDRQIVRETHKDLTPIFYFVYNRPFLAILVAHWFYLALFYNSLIHEFIAPQNMYSLFQTGLHVVAFNELSSIVSQVKNKDLYRKEWKKGHRFLVPFVHMYCMTLIPEMKWVGGIATDLCLYYYFFEHFGIVQEINQRIKIMFTNRSLEPPS